jgi:hypothetical protein
MVDEELLRTIYLGHKIQPMLESLNALVKCSIAEARKATAGPLYVRRQPYMRKV